MSSWRWSSWPDRRASSAVPSDEAKARRLRRRPARARVGAGVSRNVPGQAVAGDPHLGRVRHEPRSDHGLCRDGVVRPLRFLRRRRLRGRAGAEPRRGSRIGAGASGPRRGPRRARDRVLLDPGEWRVLHHADAGVLADVLRGDLPGGLARRRRRNRRRAPSADRRPRTRRRPALSPLPDRPRGPRRARVVAHRAVALRPRAPGDPRERSAHAGGRLRGRALQAARLRHRGDHRRPRRLAVHAVRWIDHAGCVPVDALGRGAPDGDHRRNGHALRRWARCRGLHPAPEPRQLLHRAMDAHPRTDLHLLRALRARGGHRRTARPDRAPGMTSLLEIRNLTHSFGALTAVNGVSMTVEPRERRAIIGPNGAGKTTLFNVISGHLQPTRGTIVFQGRPLGGLPPHAVARLGISRSFQRNNVFTGLSVLENLRLAAAAGERGSFSLFGSVTWMVRPLGRAREIAEAVGLTGGLETPAGALSYGEQRQLEIGIALATSPTLLLLDEPTAGMSPEETQRMTRLLAGLPRDVTVLIIEHDMDVVFSLSDRITVLHYGEVLAEGTPDAVRGDPRVYEVYLGTDDER